MGKKSRRRKNEISVRSTRVGGLSPSTVDQLIGLYGCKVNAVQNYYTRISGLPAEEVLDKVQRGMGLTTHLLAEKLREDDTTEREKGFFRLLIEGEIIGALLEFVNRADESVADIVGLSGSSVIGSKVVGATGADCPGNVHQGKGEGKVILPCVWCNLLAGLVADEILPEDCLVECRMRVASGIGNLVLLMTDDMNRICYKENGNWLPTFRQYVCLLMGLVHTNETLPIILGYEGLLTGLVQCIFWLQKRPDIVEEADRLKVDLAAIASNASNVLHGIMKGQFSGDILSDSEFFGDIDSDGKLIVRSIGTTPVTNHPECNVSFLAGIVSLLKSREDSKSSSVWVEIAQMALFVRGCVDKAVVKEVIAYGFDSTSFHGANFTLACARGMLLDKENVGDESGTLHIIQAIKRGLFDMVLQILQKHGTQPPLGVLALQIVQLIHVVSSRKKLSKVLSTLSSDSKLSTSLKLLENVAKMTNNMELKTIVLSIQTLVWMKGWCSQSGHSYCSNCKKSLVHADRQFCSRCNLAAYCSRECQVANWVDHKPICKQMCGTFAKTLSVSKNQTELVTTNLLYRQERSFMLEALIKGYMLSECYVAVMLFTAPIRVLVLKPGTAEAKEFDQQPFIKFMTAGTYQHLPTETHQLLDHFARTKESRQKQAIPVLVYSFIGEVGFMTIPTEMNVPYDVAQQQMAGEMKDTLTRLSNKPSDRNAYIEELQMQRVIQAVSRS